MKLFWFFVVVVLCFLLPRSADAKGGRGGGGFSRGSGSRGWGSRGHSSSSSSGGKGFWSRIFGGGKSSSSSSKSSVTSSVSKSSYPKQTYSQVHKSAPPNPNLYKPRLPPSYASHAAYPVNRPPPPSYQAAVGARPYAMHSNSLPPSYAVHPAPYHAPPPYHPPSRNNDMMNAALFYGLGRAHGHSGGYYHYHYIHHHHHHGAGAGSRSSSTEPKTNTTTPSTGIEIANETLSTGVYALNESVAALPLYGYEHLNWTESHIVHPLIKPEPKVEGVARMLSDSFLSIGNWLFGTPSIEKEFQELERQFSYDSATEETFVNPWLTTTTPRTFDNARDYYLENLTENLKISGEYFRLLGKISDGTVTREELDEMERLKPKYEDIQKKLREYESS